MGLPQCAGMQTLHTALILGNLRRLRILPSAPAYVLALGHSTTHGPRALSQLDSRISRWALAHGSRAEPDASACRLIQSTLILRCDNSLAGKPSIPAAKSLQVSGVAIWFSVAKG
jgi:hypothetical protein